MGSEYWINTMLEKLKDCLTWIDPKSLTNYTLDTSVLTNNAVIDKAKESLRGIDTGVLTNNAVICKAKESLRGIDTGVLTNNAVICKAKESLRGIDTGVLTNNATICKAKESLRGIDIEMYMNYLSKMLKSYGHNVVAMVDVVFPPGARTEVIKRYVHVVKPYFVPGAALLLIILFFRHGGGGGGVRMMRAPGRNHIRIPRASFENNPRAYFRDLRG